MPHKSSFSQYNHADKEKANQTQALLNRSSKLRATHKTRYASIDKEKDIKIEMELATDYALLIVALKEHNTPRLQKYIADLLTTTNALSEDESDVKWYDLPKFQPNGGSKGGVKSSLLPMFALLSAVASAGGQYDSLTDGKSPVPPVMDRDIKLFKGPTTHTKDDAHQREVDMAHAVTTVSLPTFDGVMTMKGEIMPAIPGTQFVSVMNVHSTGVHQGLVMNEFGQLSDGVDGINKCLSGVATNAIQTCTLVTGEILKKSDSATRKKKSPLIAPPPPKAPSSWFSITAPENNDTRDKEIVVPNDYEVNPTGYGLINMHHICDSHLQLPYFTVLSTETGINLVLDYPLVHEHVDLASITLVLNNLIDNTEDITDADLELLRDFSVFVATDYAKLHHTFKVERQMWLNYPANTLGKIAKQCTVANTKLVSILSGQENSKAKNLTATFADATAEAWVNHQKGQDTIYKKKAATELETARVKLEAESAKAKQELEEREAEAKAKNDILKVDTDAARDATKIENDATLNYIGDISKLAFGVVGEIAKDGSNVIIDVAENAVVKGRDASLNALGLNSLAGKIIAGIVLLLGLTGGLYCTVKSGANPIIMLYNTATGTYSLMQFIATKAVGIIIYLPMLIYQGLKKPTTADLAGAVNLGGQIPQPMPPPPAPAAAAAPTVRRNRWGPIETAEQRAAYEAPPNPPHAAAKKPTRWDVEPKKGGGTKRRRRANQRKTRKANR